MYWFGVFFLLYYIYYYYYYTIIYIFKEVQILEIDAQKKKKHGQHIHTL